MIKFIRCFIVTCITLNVVNAQDIHGVMGADAAMQGGVTTTQKSVFSVVNNPAQMVNTAKWQMGVYSQQRFGVKELNLNNVSVLLPTKYLHVGMGITYFGFNSYNQQRYTLSVAKQLADKFSLGVQLNYAQTTIIDYGNAGAFLIGAGVQYAPSTKLKVGLMLYNPTQQEMSGKVSDKLPAFARFGLNYEVNAKVNTMAEVEQTLTQTTRFRAGITYWVQERIKLGLGISNQPVLFSFGAGVKFNRLVIDMAAGIHQVLGVVPQVGIRLPLEKLN